MAQLRAPRQDGVRQLHVLGEGAGGVVAAADGVGGGDDGAARLQLRHDARLADADALLLHRLQGPKQVSSTSHVHLGVSTTAMLESHVIPYSSATAGDGAGCARRCVAEVLQQPSDGRAS
jgi:hypothetical protein